MDYLKYLLIPLLLSAFLTPFLKVVATRLEIYALENERTVHSGKIARIGGVAIYISFVVCMAVFMKTDMTINGILIGGSIMFIGGLIDDMVNLSPKLKLLFEIAAAIVLMMVGKVSLDVIRLPLGITIDMGIISFLVTFVWIIGITNAVNLIDGLDGLAGGISTIILIVVACLSAIEGRMDIQTMSLILAGATMGFLIYNSHPASIFMGDCGALFLGFIISAISLLGFKSSTIMTLALPILLLAVPIVDTLGAILRRKLSGHKFSDADKKHVHHLLMQRFGQRNTVLILYVVTALFGFTAYIYLVNKTAGFVVLFIIALIVELFIEGSGMISKQFHPLLSVIRGVKKRFLIICHKFSKRSN
jgi:undecaprenyl-phosphate N-acetylglucosaminyl 1-phosphate transferase